MTLSDFHFIRPFWLLALVPTALLFLSLVRRRQEAGVWADVCDAELLPYLLQQKQLPQSKAPLVSGAIVSVLAIFALAGPTWERLPSPVFRNESALVIALDLSLSMNAADITPSRLIRARYKIADILKRRKDGQTALLVYSGNAFTVTPLTNDTETIDSQLSALSTDIMPSQGSNTVEALQKAANLLKQAGLPQGQILLVTDGVAGDNVVAAVDRTTQQGIAQHYTVSVLAVGTADGAPIKAAEGDFVKDAQGNIVIPKLDISALQAVAEAGKGILVRLSDDNSDVDRLTDFFAQAVVQQNSDNQKLLLQQWADMGPWLVLGILPLASLFFRKGLLSLVLLLFLPFPKSSYALEWNDLWQTKDQQALQAFQQQEFTKAADAFKNPEWQAAAQYKAGQYDKALESLKSIDSADSFYNQGNALAQSGKLAEAIKAYEEALKRNPDDADAKYNKDLVEKELKKQQEQQQKDNKEQSSSDQNKDQEQQNQDQQKDKENQDSQNKSEEQQEQQNADQDQDKSSPTPKPTEQPNAEQKPKHGEQKPEEQKAPKQDKPEEQHANAAEQPAKQSPEEQGKDAKALTPEEREQQDESKQANEQWLKRIPDDPAGLLKRKFKYQYGQQEHSAPANPNNW